MAERLDVGALLGRMATVVAGNRIAVLAFVAVMTGFGTIIDLYGGTAPTALLLYGLASMVAYYLLARALLHGTGLKREGEGGGFGSYIMVGILSGLGIMLGFLLLVIPGVVLMARWLPADALVLSEGKGASESLSESWDMTREHFWPLLAVMLIGFVPYVIGVLLFGTGTGFYQVPLEGTAYQVGVAATNLLIWCYSVFSTALSVAAYWMLRRDHHDIEAVFA